MYKYYKYAVITAIWFISTASFASNNLQKTTNNFNFKNLSAQKNYSALQSSLYDPAEAIAACKMSTGTNPGDFIWLTDPKKGFPSPEPTDSDCEISSQMAYGCNDYDNYTGRALTKSVVGIMRQNPNDNNFWHLVCTGTIIDNQWVLTAAHCVQNYPDTSLIKARNIIVVPWQELEQAGTFGVPTILHQDAFDTHNIIKVRSVNIPKAYIDIVTKAYSPDLALLKIDPVTPDMGLKPIPVADTSVLSKPETPVITSGYGRKENQEVDGQLRYRKSYYMTNMYDSNWLGGISNNYGDIFISGSKPIDYKGEKSAWSFHGSGDSGGPVLSYNSLTSKFQIEGVLSAGLFCSYAGYFAKLPYPYISAASTTYPQNYNFIKSVMNGTPDPSQIKCNGECYFKTVYVINQTSNKINSYKFNHNNNLSLGLETSTGVIPTQIAFSPANNTEFIPVKNIAFVTNFISNSISLYDVNSEGSLINPQTLSLPPGHNGPIDIVFLSEDNIVVLAGNSRSLLQYDLRLDGNWYSYKALQTLINPIHLNVIKVNNREYLLVSNDNEIAVYEWDNYNLVNNYDKLKLTSDMGKLIEIKPFGEPANTKLYVLTTNGVYIYQLTRSHKRLTFKLVKNLLNHFSSDSHIVPLYENSFAISDWYSNNVILYEVAQDNKITPENHIIITDPSGMEFDNGILYITGSPRSLYSYTISYPSLYVSTEPKTLQTGEEPTVVKINRQSF